LLVAQLVAELTAVVAVAQAHSELQLPSQLAALLQ
jgi:hypothetical protein